MEETREALVQKLLDIYSKEGNYETSVPGVWVHRSERNKVPKPHIYQPMMIFILSVLGMKRLPITMLPIAREQIVPAVVNSTL